MIKFDTMEINHFTENKKILTHTLKKSYYIRNTVYCIIINI